MMQRTDPRSTREKGVHEMTTKRASTALYMICITLLGFTLTNCASTPRQQAGPTTLEFVAQTPNLDSPDGCLISAWLHNQNTSSPNYLVTFYKVSSTQLWASGTTNGAGRVNVTVPFGVKIFAQAPAAGLTSTTSFTCPEQNSPK
jgi:hypothetical protein